MGIWDDDYDDHGDRCPNCGSANIDGPDRWSVLQCVDCGWLWEIR
jgi:hypothetical protein